MKNLIVILFILAFSTSCRIEAENVDNTTKGVNETQPSVSPPTVSTPTGKTISDSQTKTVVKSKNKNAIIGNVESGTQSVCLQIQNSNLQVGDKVQIVITAIPQEVLQAEISEIDTCEPSEFGTLDAAADITRSHLINGRAKFEIWHDAKN